jgi:DNA primase
LEDRKFEMVIAEEFKVGAAPPRDDTLAARLIKQGFSEDALRQCGLFFIRDNALLAPGNLRPRFRGRLMIPIRDHQGRVVAFTARQTTLTPEDDPAREAKYVNSPETPIFTKGNLLFNLDRAREDASRHGHPFVLVEGQLDAIRAWSVGVRTAVAPQGTAITEGQLDLLRRYHHQVECFFDRDHAGQTAALRFLPMALRAGLEVRFLTVPGDGKLDPDLLFLERGRAGYEELKSHALSAMAFACQSLLPEPQRAGPEQKARAARDLFPIIAASDSEVARSEFLQEAATQLNLSAVALAGDFTRHQRQSGPASPAPAAPPPLAVAPTAIPPERDLLLICLHFPEWGPPLSRCLPHDWIATDHPAGVLLNRFLAEFEHDTWPGREHLEPLIESAEERTLVADLLFTAPDLDDPRKAALEGLHRLRDRALLPRLREIELALASADTDGQLDPYSLLRERTRLQRQLRQPLELA